jgi:hypothetical protein
MDGGIFIRCLTSVFFYDDNGVHGVYNVVMAVRLTPRALLKIRMDLFSWR